MNLLGEDVTPTLFFFALVFYMWEIFLSVFQPKQAHESSLWRQALPVCVLYEGRWNLLVRDLPWALFGCPWIGTWSIKPGLPNSVSAPKYAHICLWWSDTTTYCQIGIKGTCDEEIHPRLHSRLPSFNLVKTGHVWVSVQGQLVHLTEQWSNPTYAQIPHCSVLLSQPLESEVTGLNWCFMSLSVDPKAKSIHFYLKVTKVRA